MLHRLPFKNGQGVVRVSQGFDSPCSVFCIYVLMNCLRSIPRRRATRLTSSSLNVGCASRQQLAQVVQSIPAHTRSVISATRRSISSESRSDPLRNWRNLQFSFSFPRPARGFERDRFVSRHPLFHHTLPITLTMPAVKT